MGRTHNQDYYKVAGSKMESRNIARMARNQVSVEAARLAREASRRQKKAAARARSEAAERPTRPLDDGAPRESQMPSALPAAAEVLNLPRSRLPPAGATPGMLGRMMRSARAAGVVAKKSAEIVIDVALAPLTVARLVRRMRARNP